MSKPNNDYLEDAIELIKLDDLNYLSYKKLAKLLIELKDRRESDLRPADKFLNATEYQQFDHVESEFYETQREFYRMIDDRFSKTFREESKIKLISELVDLQMSCETMLAKLGLDEQQRREERRKVIDKNRVRGYYEVAK